MLRSIELRQPGTLNSGNPLVAVILDESLTVDAGLAGADDATGGQLRRSVQERVFRGAKDELLHLTPGSDGPRRMLLVGTGTVLDRPNSLRRAAALAARQATALGVGEIAVFAADLDERDVEGIAAGIYAGAWEYTDLKSPPPETEKRDPLDHALIMAPDSEGARRGLAAGIAVGEGHSLSRRLAVLPGNVATPEYLAETARDIATRHGLGVTVLGRAELEAQGMGAFLAVAQGTPQDPKLIALEYRRGAADAAPIVLVGKGLCFDTGGISIKPAQAMELMKYDMCGAAGVLGAMETIARMQLPVNVVALVGATTNMPSGTAYKPGDVVRAMNGKTIEVVNTDAEGRMVLADVLAYARRYQPAVVLDAATLTGAVVIALGHTASAIFSADDALIAETIAAGKRAGEPGWAMPLWDEYAELMKSDIADVKNAGGRAAGAIAAAKFLQKFAEGYPWVHLDIAGTAYSEVDLVAIPRGPTGVPVGTFVEFVRGRAS
ncbi:MAG TPA: leucyl aminopeptidase [Gemmatimonadaceae bacterium]|nr:leucyl aminopeptidase [Gemmatimonadaceae bacterium]